MIRGIVIIYCSACVLCANAAAQIIVGGEGDAYACYRSAVGGDPGRLSSIKICDRAIEDIATKPKDRVATIVNKGILLMRREEYARALNLFDQAVSQSPDLAEGHINRGVCLLHLNRSAEAVDALTTAIDKGTTHLAEAHFNRAMAYERLGNVEAAYADLVRARELRPDWDEPVRALEGYQTSSKP